LSGYRRSPAAGFPRSKLDHRFLSLKGDDGWSPTIFSAPIHHLYKTAFGSTPHRNIVRQFSLWRGNPAAKRPNGQTTAVPSRLNSAHVAMVVTQRHDNFVKSTGSIRQP
jgi:hypothetical protein